MARVSTYLTFHRETEAAFTFYRSVFGTEFCTPIGRFGDMPPMPDQPPMPDADRELVMHVALPTLGDHVLMGSDSAGCPGAPLVLGSNVQINLRPDTRADADRLFASLSEGGKVAMPMQDMFWGDYWGNLVDRFGIHWMINCESKA